MFNYKCNLSTWPEERIGDQRRIEWVGDIWNFLIKFMHVRTRHKRTVETSLLYAPLFFNLIYHHIPCTSTFVILLYLYFFLDVNFVCTMNVLKIIYCHVIIISFSYFIHSTWKWFSCSTHFIITIFHFK